MKAKIRVFFVVSLFMVLFCIQSSMAQIIQPDSVLQKAKSIFQSVERLDINSKSGVPRSVRGTLARSVVVSDITQSKQFMRNSKYIFRLNVSTDDFTMKKSSKDELNMTHAKLQQTYKSIPVWGSELVLHSDGSNTVVEVNGRFTPDLNVDIKAAITSEYALNIALADLGQAEYRWQNPAQEKMIKEVFKDDNKTWKPMPELVIAPLGGDFENGEYRLVWKMQIPVDGAKMGNYEYFVDAKNGNIINKYNSMPDADGVSNYNGTVSFLTKYVSPSYQLYDETRSIKTYNANYSSSFPGTLLTDSDDFWNQNNSAVDAHWGATKVYDFYYNIFGRNSFDNNGAEIRSSVNAYSNGWNNAAWTGAQMIYGNGDGTTFSSLTSLDICGHELTHAVTEYSAGLIYQNEPGAINEAMSDILGTSIEFYATPTKANWLIGEECYTPATSGDALRFMNNPNNGSPQQPDTYLGTYWYPTVSNPNQYNDYGGVHYNSGVLNYAFYLMTVGGSGTNDLNTTFSVSGVGIEKTRAIAYRALTVYLTSSSNYAAARTAFLSAVSDLYGATSAEYKTVSDAFGAVGIGIKLIAKNGFDAGTIKVNSATVNSGYNYFVTNGASQTLEAIPQYYNPYDRVWNMSGSASSISYWKKQPFQGSPGQISGATNSTYSFSASSTEHKATFIADLMKRYSIYRNDQAEFDVTTPVVGAQIVEQNSGYITAPLQQTINNKTYQFAGWVTGESNNTLTITPTGNDTYTALYKYPNHTNQSTAFTNNNQRKIVKQTAVGQTTLHNVYESMGLVWYERSTNNGATWNLANNGQPLSSLPCKSPSIDYFDNDGNPDDNVLITFQRIGLYENPIVMVQHYKNGVKQSENEAAVLSYMFNNYYEDDVMPVIGYGIAGRLMLVYKESGGLFCKYGNLTGQGIQWYSINSFVQNTNENSINPTIAAIKQDNLLEFHLAWQEGESQIKYKIFRSPYPANNIVQLTTQTLSTGSGYTHNRYPSIIVMRDVNAVYTARVTWQGTRYEAKEVELDKIKKGEKQNSSGAITRIVFKSSDFNYFWSFGNNTGKPNINRHSTAYAVAWSENNGDSVKFIDQISNNIVVKTISNISGEDVQVINGSSLSDMYAVSLNATAAPYYFMRSNSLNTFSKPNLLTISSGREGVVYNEGAEFYYAIGDVKLDGNNVDFVEIPDSVKSLNLLLINEYLRSQTLSVDNTSQLLYSVQYGMIDSASTKNYLQTGKTITFGVELVDAITNNVLGRYDEVTFDENNMFSYNKLGYEVSLEGIGTNREVYLRLTTTSNDETSGYSLTQRYSDETILGKTSTKKINYTGTEKPTEYALFQNYPNPFNPVTTITYQIPKEGLVTLKIYDILGKEVTTLLNEEKQAGKYSIEFNASKLSSGVYLYELRSNEYKSTKKLLLMK